MKPTYDELLEMLDNVSATADNMLHHHAQDMSANDYRHRSRTIEAARTVCESLLRVNEKDAELVDLARNVAAFDDRLLVSSDLRLFRATLSEFRDQARAALDGAAV